MEGDIAVERDLQASTPEEEETALGVYTVARADITLASVEVPCTDIEVRGEAEGHVEASDEVTPVHSELLIDV